MTQNSGDDELHQLTRSELSCQNTHETNLRAKDRLAKVRKILRKLETIQ